MAGCGGVWNWVHSCDGSECWEVVSTSMFFNGVNAVDTVQGGKAAGRGTQVGEH